MNIRPATVDDSAALARVPYAHIFPRDYLDHFTCQEQEQDWRELIGAGIEDVLLVAEDDSGALTGYALGRPVCTRIAPYDAELVAMHVRRSHQRQRIGRALVAAMAQELQARGGTALMLWALEENGPARAFYEALGGKMIGSKTTDLGEGDVEAGEVAYGWVANVATAASTNTTR